MRIESTKCDECGRIKGEGNHWHQIGIDMDPPVSKSLAYASIWIELGRLQGPPQSKVSRTYVIHDLCGEQCFYKHIGKLLKLNPVFMGKNMLDSSDESGDDGDSDGDSVLRGARL